MSKLEIGVLVGLVESPGEEIRRVADFGLKSCQVVTWKPELYNDRVGEALLAAAGECGVSVSTLWAGYPGPKVWDFIDGPKTIGLVPPQYRQVRVEALVKAADVNKARKIPAGAAKTWSGLGFGRVNAEKPHRPLANASRKPRAKLRINNAP